MKKRTSYSLRLHPSLMEEARQVAASEDLPLSQLFKRAIAEKVSFLRRKRARDEKIQRAASNKKSADGKFANEESEPILDGPERVRAVLAARVENDAPPPPSSDALSQDQVVNAYVPGPNVAITWYQKFRPRYWIPRRP